MQDNKNQKEEQEQATNHKDSKQHKQEQSDPQLTELRGFSNPADDLEPKLADGTKSPEKAEKKHQENKRQS